jgi:hypothetical protein
MELDKIKDQFEAVVSYSQGIENPNADELLEQWYENKKDFISLFNGQLIYECPEKVTFHLKPETRQNHVYDVIDMIINTWDNRVLSDFILFCKDSFFQNVVPNDYYYSKFDIVIPKGSKMVRSFKYFEKDKEVLTDIQNYVSRIIQEDKVEGHLCFSVHPLDYLSSSENTYQWRSCHALDGDYRAGNLSYMVDNSTIICYLKGDKEEKLPCFPEEVKWNSKKWRMLLFFSNDRSMMFAGRQYPFEATSILNFIKEQDVIKKFSPDAQWSWGEWSDERVDKVGECDLDVAYYPVNGKLISANELIQDNKDSLQWNDLLHSKKYKPCYSYLYKTKTHFFNSKKKYIFLATSEYTRFHIGGRVSCLRCGKSTIEYSSSFQCKECDLIYGKIEDDRFGYCSNCGQRIFIEDGYFVGDELICEACYETEVRECELCGALVYNTEISYDRKTGKYICYNCKEYLEEEEE